MANSSKKRKRNNGFAIPHSKHYPILLPCTTCTRVHHSHVHTRASLSGFFKVATMSVRLFASSSWLYTAV